MLMLFSVAFAAGESSGSPLGGLWSFLPIILIFPIFYFLVIMPQQKQRKKHQAMLNDLKSVDSVVTTSGIIGTTVLAILFFLPSLPYFDGFPSFWKKVFPSKAITLGLDLQGCIHLVLDVKGDKAVENFVQRAADDIVNVLSQKEINNVSASRGET